jgi:hypothetical protein
MRCYGMLRNGVSLTGELITWKGWSAPFVRRT